MLCTENICLCRIKCDLSFADNDECALGIDLCDNVNGRCFNMQGSYTCACNSGYRGNRTTCVGKYDIKHSQ